MLRKLLPSFLNFKIFPVAILVFGVMVMSGCNCPYNDEKNEHDYELVPVERHFKLQGQGIAQATLKEMWRIDRKTGKAELLVTEFQGDVNNSMRLDYWVPVNEEVSAQVSEKLKSIDVKVTDSKE